MRVSVSECCEEERVGERKLTGTETTFVDPGVHICALVLEALQSVCCLIQLGTQIVDLFLVRADRIIEGASQWVWGGFHAPTASFGRRRYVVCCGGCGCGRVSYTVLRFAGGGWAVVRLQAIGGIEA